ncbi:methyltransferase domain-containing protein [Fodinicola acaciae]|uniref:methyltransferase domain-containing protein n=1 Tax=Fodinicola acaciae TaxID=2681555 RepID=UPI001FE39534|nr:methyltransferase domain-containing protein [Fodinicola acaciae]
MVNDTVTGNPQLDERTAAMLAALDAAETRPEAVALRQRSYELLRLSPGSVVADIGCGTGRAVAELAAAGHAAAGVDVDARMLAIARRRHPRLGFVEASAEKLPYADGEIDGYRMDKVMHQLAQPSVTAAEARRVLRTGGRIVLVGQDWDTIGVAADDLPLTRAIVRGMADSMPSPAVARDFRGLLVDNGFTDVRVDAVPLVFTDLTVIGSALRMAAAASGEAGWLAEQEARAESGRLTVCVVMYVAAATAA